MVPSHLVYT